MALVATKPCERCGTPNPDTANFCFHCGWPFGREALAPAPAPPEEVPVEDDWSAMTERIEIANPAAEELRARIEELPEEEEEPQPPPPPEDKAPFPARVFIEEGAGSGTAIPLGTRETLIGAKGQIDLSGDPFVASRAATLVFEEERLFLRDEGSVNGVYVKLREPGRLQRGDVFVAGERVVRYDGTVDPGKRTPTPGFLGAARPEGAVLRLTEVLRGGGSGRICHRKGPVISIGRSGCDLNFASDQRISAKHAEIRASADGAILLVDLGTARSGVLLRVRTQEKRQVFDGDVLQVGGVLLRLKFS